QLLGLKPGKTIGKTGRVKRARCWETNIAPYQRLLSADHAPRPPIFHGSERQTRIAGHTRAFYENRSILNGARSTGGVFSAAIAVMISLVIGASVSPKCACPNA